MKQSSLVLVTVLLTTTVLAAPEQLPTAIPLELDVGALQPLVDVVRPLLVKVSVLIGGLFGLYIILLLVRIHYERRNMKLLESIRYNLDQLNRHFQVPSSRERKGWFHRWFIDSAIPAHGKKQYHPHFPAKKRRSP